MQHMPSARNWVLLGPDGTTGREHVCSCNGRYKESQPAADRHAASRHWHTTPTCAAWQHTYMYSSLIASQPDWSLRREALYLKTTRGART